MASLSSRATPVTAIRTTLTTRTSPSIPLSTQTYDPIVKAVLRHRLVSNIFLLSAAHSWIFASGRVIWAQGGFSDLGVSETLLLPFRPWTVIEAVTLWIVGAIPVIVLRKLLLTSTRSPAASVEKMVKFALSKPRTFHALSVHILSAAATLALHVITAYLHEFDVHGDPKLRPFVKSKKHPYYLNGRLLFLVVSQAIAVLAFQLRVITLDRFVFRWSLASSLGANQSKTGYGIFDFIRVAVVAAIIATGVIPVACVVFGVARIILPVLHRLPLLSMCVRPFTAHFLRGSWTFTLAFTHFSLLARAWYLASFTILTWELSNVLFERYIHQPITVAQATPEPHVTLASGASSSDIIFRYFAYTELKSIASDRASSACSTIRSNLFNDQKYNPSLWSHLARESLVLLGRDYQRLLNRGKEVASPMPATIPSAKTAEPSIKANKIPLIRNSVFKSGKQSVSPMKVAIDGLASDGPLAQAVEAGAEAAHIPELFRSVSAAVPKGPSPKDSVIPAQTAPPRSLDVFGPVVQRVKSYVQRIAPETLLRYADDLDGWWRKERIHKIVQTCVLPNSEMDLVIVDVLSHLVCASLSEDKYGVVQRDIPRIIEALLLFHSAVEDYHAEVRALYVPPPLENKDISVEELRKSEALRIDVAQACEVLAGAQDGLREGVARIVRTFGDKLLAFKFPPRVAQKLQPFLEFC